MNNSRWMLIAGIVFGMITVILLYQRLESVKGGVYLRLKDDISIAKGEPISLSDITQVTLPKGQGFESLEQVAIQKVQGVGTWLKGRRVNRDIQKGSFLLYAYFSESEDSRLSAQIDTHKRALTIPVSQTSSVGYFVEPESRVDILTTYTEVVTDINARQAAARLPAAGMMKKQRVVTKTIQQNVRVLAVGGITSRAGYIQKSGGYSTVTIEVTPTEAEKLVFAMTHASSGFTLVLRNPANNVIKPIPSVSWENLQ